jgi:hypothetical protein
MSLKTHFHSILYSSLSTVHVAIFFNFSQVQREKGKGKCIKQKMGVGNGSKKPTNIGQINAKTIGNGNKLARLKLGSLAKKKSPPQLAV